MLFRTIKSTCLHAIFAQNKISCFGNDSSQTGSTTYIHTAQHSNTDRLLLLPNNREKKESRSCEYLLFSPPIDIG